jgi:hypothetical protein
MSNISELDKLFLQRLEKKLKDGTIKEEEYTILKNEITSKYTMKKSSFIIMNEKNSTKEEDEILSPRSKLEKLKNLKNKGGT